MKHYLRKEKNCLNCGANVADRFCSHCGQENLETRESFAHLLGHFFADITHYDSKFFTTIKDLLFKPGFLTREYFAGRRTKYLNPLRMYVFISFIFFLVLFIKTNNEPSQADNHDAQYANAIKQHLADSLRQAIKNKKTNTDTAVSQKDTTEAIAFSLGDSGIKFTLLENKYSDVHEYDSVQQSLQESKRDKGFMRWILRTNVI